LGCTRPHTYGRTEIDLFSRETFGTTDKVAITVGDDSVGAVAVLEGLDASDADVIIIATVAT